MAKTKQTYNKTSTVTPKGEAIWPALVTPDEQSDKFQIGVEVVEGSSEWEPVLQQLLSFQNKCLREAGEDESDSLLCLKPIKEKDEKKEPEEQASSIGKALFKALGRALKEAPAPAEKKVRAVAAPRPVETRAVPVEVVPEKPAENTCLRKCFRS